MSKMPSWKIHTRLAALCGISEELMTEINRFIDISPRVRGYDPA